MSTPICDFVKKYADSEPVRFHMPGHKGVPFLGFESLDITEITGADSLYDADGIIRESELNASSIFGARTFYSAEGSSLAIRAMLSLICTHSKSPLIWAGRNAHSTFISAAALLGFEVEWLYPDGNSVYISNSLNSEDLEKKLSTAECLPDAVYLTSPDYLGNILDIEAFAKVCHRRGVLLLVDNAHGAYLKFLKKSRHPIDLGADICCDSAHKTLPGLTGSAYLHLSKKSPFSDEEVKEAMRSFGSTSPSYLILQSLDRLNPYLEQNFKNDLLSFIAEIDALKQELIDSGFTIIGNEPLKITIAPKSYGYKGTDLAKVLEDENIFIEFADPDYVVLMFTPQTAEDALKKFKQIILTLPRCAAINEAPPTVNRADKVMSIREAYLSPFKILNADDSLGQIIARASVGCPPAVPILVCGEKINHAAVKQFKYYGINKIKAVK